MTVAEIRTTLTAARERARSLSRSERSERERGWQTGYAAACSEALAMLDAFLADNPLTEFVQLEADQ